MKNCFCGGELNSFCEGGEFNDLNINLICEMFRGNVINVSNVSMGNECCVLKVCGGNGFVDGYVKAWPQCGVGVCGSFMVRVWFG